MNEIKPADRIAELPKQEAESSDSSCSDRIVQVAQAIFSKLYSFFSACVLYCRQFVVVDVAIAMSFKNVNGIAIKYFHRPAFAAETEKSQIQKRNDQELALIKNKIGANSLYSRFSHHLALYINEVLPKYIGQQLSGIPSSSIDKTSSRELRSMHFRKWTTHFSHIFMGEKSLSTMVNFELIFLKLIVWTVGVQENVAARHRLTIILLHSLANSISNEEKIQQYLSQFSFESGEEAMIARLQWYKDNHCLPKSLPDPEQVRLFPHNVKEKIEEAIYAVIGKTLEWLHEKYLSSHFQGFFGKLYKSKGQPKLISSLTYCIAEFGFYQLADPHRFGMAILSSHGVEVSDYDLYGFGLKRKKAVLNVGQKMMTEAMQSNASWTSVVSLYEKSGLKHNPGSMEEIKQRGELKILLKKHVSSIFYGLIKDGDQFRHESYLKNIREKLSEIPIVGISTIGLHALISGTMYSFGYLSRKKQDQQKTFFVWLFKHFSGKKLCDFLADRVVELIYHPHFIFVLAELLAKVSDFLLDQDQKASDQDPFTIEEFRKITKFIFGHFTQDNQNLTRNAAVLLEYLTSEDGFQSFSNYLKPSKIDLLEMCLESLLPSIKESWLCTKIVNQFRKESVIFDGDATFWGMFTREYLNQKVERIILQKFVSGKRPSLSEEAHLRTLAIDELNEMEWGELRKVMAQAFQPLEAKAQTSVPVVQGGIKTDDIVWDYTPNQQHQQ